MPESIELPTGVARAPAVSLLRQELRDLYDEIADMLDDDRVEGLPDYFIEDGVYRITTRENYDEGLPGALMFCEGVSMLRDRILAIRETQVYEPRTWRHFVSGVHVIAVEGDVINARANFLVTEAISDRDPTVFLVGKFVDTLVRRGSRLLFRERVAVCDNHYVRRSIIMPV